VIANLIESDISGIGMTSVWTVEDNEGYRSTLVRVINQSERVRCAQAFSSCEEAVAALRRETQPDVILLDIHLPGMSGVDGVREFKSVAADTEIVMLTMYSHHSAVFQALCAGASGYLLKTATPETIVQSISDVVNGGAPMSPQIARSVLTLFAQHNPANSDYGLSAREKAVLELLVKGQTKKEIADQIEISYHTVDKHVRGIYSKLHVHSLSAAVAKAVKEKLF
jgi:DNA-binding NarL/FixJ family response regulator